MYDAPRLPPWSALTEKFDEVLDGTVARLLGIDREIARRELPLLSMVREALAAYAFPAA